MKKVKTTCRPKINDDCLGQNQNKQQQKTKKKKKKKTTKNPHLRHKRVVSLYSILGSYFFFFSYCCSSGPKAQVFLRELGDGLGVRGGSGE